MSTRVAVAALAALSFALDVGPGQAQAPKYPWCADYHTESGQHGACGFYTYQQCMSYVSGLQGTCYRNPDYYAPGPTATPKVSRKKNTYYR